ncbi:hydrogenase accessory protein [Siculibacillus lacustris]|uniref:Hydrogenase expression/formation protein n=1 Tax=Siculibacillus lacustris TaxID=1549641 RepID=A0A4Q9VV72_9HYPH|nr:hydrogenase accessory protein [Siculibacillus lacustris]TBW40029.1 hydrogenase accessory protein [Siculibacillus lacustris]
MTSPWIEALGTRHGLPTVDATTIDAFLTPAQGEAAHALLFFTGDPAQRSETTDVAVVLPELLAAFAGRLRAAVVARDAEAALAPRFRVVIHPSLVVVRDGRPIAVMPKIRDWSDYLATIAAALDPEAPALAEEAPPRVEFTRSHKGSEA